MLDADAIYQRLLTAGETWTDLSAAAQALDLAAETMAAREFLTSPGNIEERKALSKTSEPYQELRTAALTAWAKANKARVKYDTARVYCDMLRTVESTRRAEIEKGL